VGWIEDYLSYNERQESPEIFHYWSAITTVAAVLNRQVWLPKISDGILRYTIYPGQIMTWLVARSAIDRKSTSLHLPSSLLQLAGVEVLHGTCSPEELQATLGAHGTHNKKGILTILSGELSVFYSTQQYNSKLIDIITDMSDAPDKRDYRTRGGGKITIRDACLTFLGCTTPSSIAEAIPARAHAHGFTSRHIVVYPPPNRKRRIESLVETKIDPVRVQWARDLKQKLLEGLLRYRQLRGSFDYTPEAAAWYDDWYHDYINKYGDEAEGWLGRKQDHLLRVGMVLQVCKNESLTLERSTLEKALADLNKTEETRDEAFAQIGVHSNTAGVDRILAIFKKHSGVVDNFTILEQAMRYFPDFQSLKRVMSDMLALKWIERIKYDADTGLEVYSLVRPDQRHPTFPPSPKPNTHAQSQAQKQSQSSDIVDDILDNMRGVK
jgi:hypothetical protein